MERVAPRQVNYDNILPLAIESRSNRREFLPVNGQTFSNSNGATIIRIDVNADSMLDATHSYLECDITNNNTTTDNFLAVNGFGPGWIQRLRIESGGTVIEDINEYSRLYSMLTLNQCPKDFVQNNFSNMGMYDIPHTGNLLTTAASALQTIGGGGAQNGTGVGAVNLDSELHYNMSAQTQVSGVSTTTATGQVADAAENRPTDGGLVSHASVRLTSTSSKRMCIPLVSGFLNMDKYIPLIMMNAGFTIELHICDANRIGVCQVEAADTIQGALITPEWTISNCKYVAHLIDLDRSFYDRLRAVMESSAGVLQLAGQTYRHYVGSIPNSVGPHTVTIPARVKSVKSIFGTFIDSTQVGNINNFDTPVFQTGHLSKYRFEIGSVRYPQTDVDASDAENFTELEKAFGKLGDYQHQQAYSAKHTLSAQGVRDGLTNHKSLLSAYSIGYDFEAFQRVALEAGINTADRSLPINFICERSSTTTNATRADFYVLTDAIYYINLDGTVSVSV
jgi:hypothetical protein